MSKNILLFSGPGNFMRRAQEIKKMEAAGVKVIALRAAWIGKINRASALSNSKNFSNQHQEQLWNRQN